MKLMKTLKILMLFSIVSILLLSTMTSATTIDQTRPNVIYHELTQFYDNQLIKGNNSDSAIELLFNSATFVGQRNIVRGDANISQTPTELSITGSVDVTQIQTLLSVQSGIQFDQYLTNYPVNQRFNFVPLSIVNAVTVSQDIDNVYPISVSYDDLEASDDFVQIQRGSIDTTAFVYRGGVVRSAILNDTDGGPLATVVGFHYTLSIIFYETSSKELVGFHSESAAGHGNIFPVKVIDYLNNQTFVRQIGQDTSGIGALEGEDRISWIYTGYNSTLDLDVHYARFQMARQATSLLFTSDDGSLSLSSVSLGVELFLNELEEDNALVLEPEEVSTFDEAVVNDALDQEEIQSSTSSVTSSESEIESTPNSSDSDLNLNTAAIFGAQIFALVVVGNILYRRYR